MSKMSVARQFVILATLGVLLTVTGLGLALRRSHDLAYDAKRMEIQHEAEEGASIVRHFVQREQSGDLTRDEAQKRAREAVAAIRFQAVNYIALLGFDGVSISNANKEMIGRNVIDLKDPFGNPITRAQLAVATSGTPGFVEFYFKKLGETTPKLKMSYNIGVPEWQWDVTTGDFADDLDAMLIDGIIRLSMIFVPLFVGYLAIVYVMRRSLARLLGSLSGAMRRLAQGDLGTEITGRTRRDEIGQMTEALLTFRQAAIDKARLETEAVAAGRRADDERTARERDQAAAAEAQTQVVVALASGLEKLSDGDLTFRLVNAFSPEYEKLRGDFNGAMDKLQDTLRTVAGNTQSVHSGSGEITRASDDLSRRTEQQAALAGADRCGAGRDHLDRAQDRRECHPCPGRRGGRGERGRELGRGRAGCGDGDGGDRAVCRPNQPDHRGDRRDRVPDEFAGVERGCGGGAGWRRRTGVCGGGVRGAGPRPALGRGGEGDQGVDRNVHPACDLRCEAGR